MFHVPQSRDMNKTKHFEYNRDDCCPRPAQPSLTLSTLAQIRILETIKTEKMYQGLFCFPSRLVNVKIFLLLEKNVIKN